MGDALFAECSALCRVSKHGHSAKRQSAEWRTRQRPSLPSVKHSAKRDTRQTSYLPSVRHSVKNNPRQNTSGDTGGPPVIFCRVLAVSTRQTCCLCRVLQVWHSAKYFFFKFFLWHLYSTLKHMFQFRTFLWLFGIFFKLFMFTWFFLKKVNLNSMCMKYWNLAIQKIVFMFLVYFEAVCRDIREISNIYFTKHDQQLVKKVFFLII